MDQIGFIHDKLDIKLLVLYIMARVVSPIDFPTLTDLSLCDAGVDYFTLSEAVTELVATGHLKLDKNHYAITEKGIDHSKITESSLPYSVRLKCDKNLIPVNTALRRAAQVRSSLTPKADGSFTLTLDLDDNDGNLFSLSLVVGSEERGKLLCQRFQEAPEQVYSSLLEALFPTE